MKVRLFTLQLILLNSLPLPCSGQVLSLGYGQMFHNSKTIVPVVNQYEETANEEYYSLDLTLFEIDRCLLGAELSSYKGWVDFNAEVGLGFGSSLTRLLRLSPYLGYILKPNHKFRFIPYFKVIIEQSFITGLEKGYSHVTDIDRPNGHKGTIFVEPIKRLQLAPGAGLMLSWNPVGKMYLIGNIYYTYGYRPFQKYYFEYSYQGVEQPTAEWHANGTGVFTSIGIGFKLWSVDKNSKGRR
ncbi:MAG: hypothetical protein IPP15_08710 [Saprospiraceae bacterium]|uniref:Uncharacterized protein n=1 Tax=Candidatus Opimibacter skivensis TaxID=2982028 RepID=A0A9D7SUU3_9BACT|nr:hypothetical protein [Candidatus Opimibacter skivensis]